MSREIRMVPPGWQHPKDAKGNFVPLLNGPYSKQLADWIEADAKWSVGEIEDWDPTATVKKWIPIPPNTKAKTYADWNGKRPVQADYMPEWKDGEATMLCMYESTSEGTPISPAFATPEDLARWLANTRASAFAGMTASYEEWLATCRAGRSVASMVIENGRMMSGVEASDTEAGRSVEAEGALDESR